MIFKLIEKSGTGIEKSGTGLKWYTSVPVLLIALLFWNTAATADTSIASDESEVSRPEFAINEDLATVSFIEGYKSISGYGHVIDGYARVSLYSVEYVHVIGSEASSDASLQVQGAGTNSVPEEEETAPVQGAGTNSTGSGNQLKAWGIAEVVLSERGIADIIVYRLDDEGVLEEVGVYSGVEVH